MFSVLFLLKLLKIKENMIYFINFYFLFEFVYDIGGFFYFFGDFMICWCFFYKVRVFLSYCNG